MKILEIDFYDVIINGLYSVSIFLIIDFDNNKIKISHTVYLINLYQGLSLLYEDFSDYIENV